MMNFNFPLPWISASILNCDLARLAEVAASVENCGADFLHFDVMDGRFVENLTFGMPVLASLRKCTKLPLDVHLMISDPLHYAERFVKAGADLLSFHIESDSDPAETLRVIQGCGISAGIAVSPDTPVETVYPLLPLLRPEDFVLLMTVRPGLGGQAFMPEVLPKIKALRTRLNERGQTLHIQVDGGVNAETGRRCREAGADFLVAGSYLLGSADSRAAAESLRF